MLQPSTAATLPWSQIQIVSDLLAQSLPLSSSCLDAQGAPAELCSSTQATRIPEQGPCSPGPQALKNSSSSAVLRVLNSPGQDLPHIGHLSNTTLAIARCAQVSHSPFWLDKHYIPSLAQGPVFFSPLSHRASVWTLYSYIPFQFSLNHTEDLLIKASEPI